MKKGSVFLAIILFGPVLAFAQGSKTDFKYVKIDKYSQSPIIKISEMQEFENILRQNGIDQVFVMDVIEAGDVKTNTEFIFALKGVIYATQAFNFTTLENYKDGKKKGFDDGRDYYLAMENGVDRAELFDVFKKELFFSGEHFRNYLANGFQGSSKKLKFLPIPATVPAEDFEKYFLPVLFRDKIQSPLPVSRDADYIQNFMRMGLLQSRTKDLYTNEYFYRNDLGYHEIAYVLSALKKSYFRSPIGENKNIRHYAKDLQTIYDFDEKTQVFYYGSGSGQRARYNYNEPRGNFRNPSLPVPESLIYNIARIEGHKNFESFEKFSLAMKNNFSSVDDYEKAVKHGFSSGYEYYDAAKKGFTENRDYENARKAGITAFTEFAPIKEMTEKISRLESDFTNNNKRDAFLYFVISRIPEKEIWSIEKVMRSCDEFVENNDAVKSLRIIEKGYFEMKKIPRDASNRNHSESKREIIDFLKNHPGLGTYHEEGEVFRRN